MTSQLLSPTRAALLLVAAVALAAAPQAQTVFDDFDDGDVTDVLTFSANGGAGIGVGTTTGLDGSDASALSVGIDPAAAGAFAGVVVPGGDGTTDISGANAITFQFRATSNGMPVQAGNLPLTLEVNLQEDADDSGAFEAGVDDEFQAVYQVELSDEYVDVLIPFSAFADDNTAGAGSDDGFDFENLEQIVFAFGGLQGPEFAFAIDEIVFTEETQLAPGMITEFDFFDDGDVTDVLTFSANGGAGIGVGTTTGLDGSDASALSVGIDPAAAGAFAGVVVPGGDGTTDISGANAITFQFRATSNGMPVQAGNLPLTLEVNLQEDADDSGAFEAGVDDEFQAVYQVELSDEYVDVLIPFSAFADDNTAGAGSDDGFDFENLEQIVFAFGGLQGPEFAFAIDNLGFTTTMSTSTVDLPATFDTAPSVFPNPSAGPATLAFDLAAPSDVSVDVVDILGRRVAQVASGLRPAGAVRLAVPTDGLSAGVYVVRVRTDSGVAATRLTVIR